MVVCILKENCEQYKINKMKGKLIVIDGTDGVGKATQTAKLVKRLETEGYQTETLDFPRYKEHFGKLIGECLNGMDCITNWKGDPKDVGFASLHPKIASVLYAADRFDTSSTIEKWLLEGKVVVLDRYVSANQIHQGGKITDENERKEFLKWLDHMEHGIFKIPRPDKIIYLDVPIEITQKLLQEKSSNIKKEYKKSGIDAHENNVDHLIAAKISGLKMVEQLNSWERIECYSDNQLISLEGVHERIWQIVLKVLN